MRSQFGRHDPGSCKKSRRGTKAEEERRRREEEAKNNVTPEQPVTPSNPNNGSSGGSGAAPYDPVTGNVIVDRAYGCIGLPYVWGATGRTLLTARDL